MFLRCFDNRRRNWTLSIQGVETRRLDQPGQLHAAGPAGRNHTPTRPIDIAARDASGPGTVLYWSHLLDSLLLVLPTPLMSLLGEHAARRWAGVMLGPLSAGLLGLALAWARALLSEPRSRCTAALCCAAP